MKTSAWAILAEMVELVLIVWRDTPVLVRLDLPDTTVKEVSENCIFQFFKLHICPECQLIAQLLVVNSD